jgi:hypothetical protein
MPPSKVTDHASGGPLGRTKNSDDDDESEMRNTLCHVSTPHIYKDLFSNGGDMGAQFSNLKLKCAAQRTHLADVFSGINCILETNLTWILMLLLTMMVKYKKRHDGLSKQ